MGEALVIHFINVKNRIKKDGVLTNNPEFKDYIKYMFYKIRRQIFLKVILTNRQYSKDFDEFVNGHVLHDEYFARMSIHNPCVSEYRNLSACQVLKHYIDRKRITSNVNKNIGNLTHEISFPVIIVFTQSYGNELDYDELSDTTDLVSNHNNYMSFNEYKKSNDKKEEFVDNILQINSPRFSRMFRDKNLENRYRIDTNVIIGGTKHSRKKRRTRNKRRNHKTF
jgi:hypothetical protein